MPRHKFTQKEDEHLVEYLATQTIGFQATSGNQLYKKLTENLQRWPWAESRSWQSWRDRYVKNQESFNRYIKRYRKEAAKRTEGALANPGKRKHESDEGVASKRPKLADREEDNDGTKAKTASKPLPPPTVASQAIANKAVTHSDSGQDNAGGRATILTEPSKAKASTTKAPVSLFTQVFDEESDSRETPGPDDYNGEIFGDDPQEQDDEHVMDVEMIVESDHDPTDVSEVEELLTPSRSKIAATSRSSERKTPPSQNGRRLYPDISQLPSPHLQSKERPAPASSSSNHKPNPQPKTMQDHPITRPLKKPLRKRHPSPDSGFFESPASSSRAPSPQRVRQLPRLTEGPFGGHRLAGSTKRGVPNSDSDSDSEPKKTWPPVRGKATRRLTALEKGKGKATEDTVVSEAAPSIVDSLTTRLADQVSEDVSLLTSRPLQGVTTELVDRPSNSEDTLNGKAAVSPLTPPEDSKRMAIVLPKELPSNVLPSNQRSASLRTVDKYNSLSKLPTSLPSPPKGLQRCFVQSVPPDAGPSRPRFSAAPSDDGEEEIVTNLLSDDNPFIAPAAPPKQSIPFLDLRSMAKKPIQRRYTLAAPPPPRIDLRKEAFKRASRKSLPGTSISAPISTKDSISELGKSLMHSWTKRFGLPEDRVRKVWEEELSIENTEKRLQRVKQEHEKSLTPTRRVKRKSAPKMDIDVLPDDEDIDGYEPPYSSRARRFAKLSKQGRVKEALDRDRRRATESGVKIDSPLKKASPLWGEAEDKLLRTVNAHNVNSLRELEKKVGYAFMLEKVRDVALLNLV
ncbi:uncharacterized protein EV420DRAFT_592260 [Desarmillaria tabescens]|uniref:TERF2-interacting telomeric protein 1 Myb domain-containing protein n=1 Tax=Armillaria tabescens TaxID=1929756 RepID=A0AA39K8B2_ARMTA|nr:uncharacterized protein EV420DRAFT_592260 [Desarmillaria tabescens]KAK0455280.1 hypothetical protein EV420DRAFT_592260 [Desarmillaria tabescens]